MLCATDDSIQLRIISRNYESRDEDRTDMPGTNLKSLLAAAVKPREKSRLRKVKVFDPQRSDIAVRAEHLTSPG